MWVYVRWCVGGWVVYSTQVDKYWENRKNRTHTQLWRSQYRPMVRPADRKTMIADQIEQIVLV